MADFAVNSLPKANFASKANKTEYLGLRALGFNIPVFSGKATISE